MLRMGKYPVNDTAYSDKRLCEELPICAEARTVNLKHFDLYCSGNFEKCPGKILTSPFEKDINLESPVLVCGGGF